MTNEISLHTQKQAPLSVILKKGNWYNTTNGDKAQIVGIRTNGEDTIVYYRKRGYNSKWYKPSWNFSAQSIKDFKAHLIDLGSIDNIKVTPF